MDLPPLPLEDIALRSNERRERIQASDNEFTELIEL
jgi:hypothetical protein